VIRHRLVGTRPRVQHVHSGAARPGPARLGLPSVCSRHGLLMNEADLSDSRPITGRYSSCSSADNARLCWRAVFVVVETARPVSLLRK
jgi:hypothetical protein